MAAYAARDKGTNYRYAESQLSDRFISPLSCINKLLKPNYGSPSQLELHQVGAVVRGYASQHVRLTNHSRTFHLSFGLQGCTAVPQSYISETHDLRTFSSVPPPLSTFPTSLRSVFQAFAMASFRAGIGFLLFIMVSRVLATCYFPNGTATTNEEFQPCVAITGVVSMCCATNRTQFADECLSNGLCHNPCATTGLCGDTTGGQYWRETCTDKTWNSPFCLKNVCTNPAVSRARRWCVEMTR